jgi:hypothetical protein
MMTLDSMRVKAPIDALLGYDESAFSLITQQKTRELPVSRHRELHTEAIRSICGLGAIVIGEDHFTVETSAKILGDLYHRGISSETLDRYVDGIAAAGIIELDKGRFVSEAEVLRCDVTRNLHVDDVHESLRQLNLLAVNDRYSTEPYEGTGVVFRRRVKTAPVRMTCYDKHKEMASHNRKWIAAGKLDPDPFKGVLRMEMNLKNHEPMRRMLNVENPRLLLDVLSSDANPLLAVYDDIAAGTIAGMSAEFVRLCSEKGGAIRVVKRLGWIRVFEVCGWEWDVVRVWIKGTYGQRSNAGRVIRDARRMFAEEKRKRDEPKGGINRLEEIRGLLRIAA